MVDNPDPVCSVQNPLLYQIKPDAKDEVLNGRVAGFFKRQPTIDLSEHIADTGRGSHGHGRINDKTNRIEDPVDIEMATAYAGRWQQLAGNDAVRRLNIAILRRLGR